MIPQLQVRGVPSVFRGSFLQYRLMGGNLLQLAKAFQRVFNGTDWRYGLPIDRYLTNVVVFDSLNADLIVHELDGEIISMGVGYSFDKYPPHAELTTYPSRETLIGAGAPAEEGGYYIDVVLTLPEYRKAGLAYEAFQFLAESAAGRRCHSIISWTELSVWESKKQYFTSTGRTARGEFDPPGLPERAVVLVGPVGPQLKVVA